jgi:hypothetical protein
MATFLTERAATVPYNISPREGARVALTAQPVNRGTEERHGEVERADDERRGPEVARRLGVAVAERGGVRRREHLWGVAERISGVDMTIRGPSRASPRRAAARTMRERPPARPVHIARTATSQSSLVEVAAADVAALLGGGDQRARWRRSPAGVGVVREAAQRVGGARIEVVRLQPRMTGTQNDASAKPPCTRTTAGVSVVSS